MSAVYTVCTIVPRSSALAPFNLCLAFIHLHCLHPGWNNLNLVTGEQVNLKLWPYHHASMILSSQPQVMTLSPCPYDPIKSTSSYDPITLPPCLYDPIKSTSSYAIVIPFFGFKLSSTVKRHNTLRFGVFCKILPLTKEIY